MDFIVGTFNTATIYSLRFQPPCNLAVLQASPAVGSHSFLALSPSRIHLYATAWLQQPSVISYRVQPDHTVALLNQQPVKSRSGYVAASATHLYSAGGSSGEVFALNADGSVGDTVQELCFNDAATAGGQNNSADAHGGFGGLRHGAHSIDLSPDGKSVFVADIGRNCIWVYKVADENALATGKPHLAPRSKHISPRANDGPRHTTPHPNGRILYSVQEHSSMVDSFSINTTDLTLEHAQGVKIIPADKDPKDYWADEVRVSVSKHGQPEYLYASTRGLEQGTKGYVAVFKLAVDGSINGEALHIWETPTSGGIANAVEPAPAWYDVKGTGYEYMALTDSQEGWVFVLSFDGETIRECARLKLEDKAVDVVQAATAVWL